MGGKRNARRTLCASKHESDAPDSFLMLDLPEDRHIDFGTERAEGPIDWKRQGNFGIASGWHV